MVGAAARELSLTECVNPPTRWSPTCPACISDYLYSGKPYAVTDMGDEGDRFVERFPLAGSGYVLRRDMSNVDEVLTAPAGHRPAGRGALGHPRAVTWVTSPPRRTPRRS